MKARPVGIVVNGELRTATIEPRVTLLDVLRDELDLTGAHAGCEQGVCGACTVIVDGEAVRSCLMFAVMAEGARVETIEGLAEPGGGLTPLQEAFREAHGLQCGYCTPGMIMAAEALLRENPDPDEPAIRHALSGNLCRCTGYAQIVEAVLLAAAWRRQREPEGAGE